METPEPAGVPQPAKERRWLIGLLVAFITAIAADFAVVPVAEWAMEMHHVSNMEGGRGYAIMCAWIPFAFIVGSVTGFVVSLLLSGRGFVGFLRRLGVSLAVVVVLITLCAGLSYVSVDHPPLINGQELALEIEVEVPAKGRTVEQLKTADFQVALVVTNTDRSYCELRWAEAREAEGK